MLWEVRFQPTVCEVDAQLVVAVPIQFERLGQPRLALRADLEPIDDHFDRVLEVLRQPDRLGELAHLAALQEGDGRKAGMIEANANAALAGAL